MHPWPFIGECVKKSSFTKSKIWRWLCTNGTKFRFWNGAVCCFHVPRCFKWVQRRTVGDVSLGEKWLSLWVWRQTVKRRSCNRMFQWHVVARQLSERILQQQGEKSMFTEIFNHLHFSKTNVKANICNPSCSWSNICYSCNTNVSHHLFSPFCTLHCTWSSALLLVENRINQRTFLNKLCITGLIVESILRPYNGIKNRICYNNQVELSDLLPCQVFFF